MVIFSAVVILQLCGLINKNTVVCVNIYLSHNIISCHQRLEGGGGYTVLPRGHKNIGRKACGKYQAQLFNNFMCMRNKIIIENLLFNTERYVVGKNSDVQRFEQTLKHYLCIRIGAHVTARRDG